MNFEEVKLMAISSGDVLKKADAIVCLEGDGQIRTQKSLELFNEKWAPIIVVSGGLRGFPFSVPADKMAEYLIKKGIPKNKIIIENTSQNTYDQATEVMKIIREKKWKSVILVASEFHQPRAYLTFLKAMEKFKLELKIFNAPASHLWFEKTKWGFERIDLLRKEFEKIKDYQKKGHLLSIEKALKYQEWKEKQV